MNHDATTCNHHQLCLERETEGLRTALKTMQDEFARHQYCGWNDQRRGVYCESCDATEPMPHSPFCDWWEAYAPSVPLVGEVNRPVASVREKS